MPKGKRFDAVEKHFEKRKCEYERKIKYLSTELEESKHEALEYKRLYESVSGENEQLKAWIERLLEYTELSMDDIKQACEKDKRMGEAVKIMSTLFKLGGAYY